MKISVQVEYFSEASELADILLKNGYGKVEIQKVYNSPLSVYYVVSYEDKMETPIRDGRGK